MTGTPIIGGKADGDTTPMRLVRATFMGDMYMLCSFRDKEGEHFFYQSAGATPAETIKIYNERFNK